MTLDGKHRAYPRLVRTRERFEHKIGKPPAAAYAILSSPRAR